MFIRRISALVKRAPSHHSVNSSYTHVSTWAIKTYTIHRVAEPIGACHLDLYSYRLGSLRLTTLQPDIRLGSAPVTAEMFIATYGFDW